MHIHLFACSQSTQRVSQVVQVIKNTPTSAGDVRRGRFDPVASEGGPGNTRQSYLENPMDRGVQRTTVHRVTKSWTRLRRLSMHACGRKVFLSYSSHNKSFSHSNYNSIFFQYFCRVLQLSPQSILDFITPKRNPYP